MNRQKRQLLSGTGMRFWPTRLLLLGLLALCLASWLVADQQHVSTGLTVHEWGTFTAIAGNDGDAMEWTSLTVSDLPGFVEHLAAANLKLGLRGTIRMETPVLYFYSPRDVTVSVRVAFSKGLITEWYPGATGVQPNGALRNVNLNELQGDGSIAWKNVVVSPDLSGDFPREVQPNRYYAARETSSTPLRVQATAGGEQEKFLFYRGVSNASLPLNARQMEDGGVLVRNLIKEEIPSIMLFERRGSRVGYRAAGALANEVVLDPPALTGNMAALCGDLEGILLDQGLYSDEAHAMVETWRDSWFEEGSRLIYIVPRGFIDKVVPLTINPNPDQTARVFVGRLEIVTPLTVRAVEAAVAANDEVVLNQYGRFLEPILRIARENTPSHSANGGGR